MGFFNEKHLRYITGEMSGTYCTPKYTVNNTILTLQRDKFIDRVLLREKTSRDRLVRCIKRNNLKVLYRINMYCINGIVKSAKELYHGKIT